MIRQTVIRIGITFIIVYFFAFRASAGIIINSGLDVQGGVEEISMKSGQSLYLHVRHSVWKYPIWKGLQYASQYPSVASVDQNGRVRAGIPGKSVISIWNDNGDNANVTILVTTEKKVSRPIRNVLIALFILFLSLYLIKILRCFK